MSSTTKTRTAPAEAAGSAAEPVALPEPTRGRVSRADEEVVRRRRRDFNDTSGVKRLGLDESKLDRQNYHYRWVNMTPGRPDHLYAQDWEFVSNDELGLGAADVATLGNERSAVVGVGAAPMTARLMKKRKDFFLEDHAIRQKRIDDEMKAAELGRTVLNGPQASDAGLNAGDPRVYQPRDAESSNKL